MAGFQQWLSNFLDSIFEFMEKVKRDYETEYPQRPFFHQGIDSALIAFALPVMYYAHDGFAICDVSRPVFCIIGFIMIMVVSFFVICLHFLPPRITNSFANSAKARLGIFFPLVMAMYQAFLVLGSNIFSILNVTCTNCIVSCLLLSLSFLIFECHSNRAHSLNLAGTFMSISMSLTVSSYIAKEVAFNKIVWVWALCSLLYLLIGTRSGRRAPILPR